MTGTSLVSQFEKALDAAGIQIFRFDPSKSRSITIHTGGCLPVEKLSKNLVANLGPKVVKFPEVFEALHDISKFTKLVERYSVQKGILVEEKQIEVPEYYKSLILNLDQSHSGQHLKFFMTTKEEFISSVAGNVYLRVCGIGQDDALSLARKVVPEYRPRSKPGIVKQAQINREEVPVFNSYVPPAWMHYKGELPDRLPILFEKLVNHLFPLKIEREYFYDWVYASLFDRAFVYLILCGPGGTGKNRLKLVLRALHGHQNTVDGKRSTLRERFNSQLADSTLAWFDELHYDMEMENVMKEVQNDSISIERKGVDATRSTKIYASLVISNNKPRDNYIAFDARKFVPLQISPRRLDDVMSSQELDDLTAKVEDWTSDQFDIAFIAQIGRWIQKHAGSEKWKRLEYKGPMFYKLAHTSMSRWQKKAASTILEGTGLTNSRITLHPTKGYLWSTISEHSQKKSGDRALQYPDFSTVKHFFDIFVDGEGNSAFKTTPIPRSIMGDFYVKLINENARILTEAEVLGETETEDDNYEDLDL